MEFVLVMFVAVVLIKVILVGSLIQFISSHLIHIAIFVAIMIGVAYIAEAYIKKAVENGKHEYTVRHNVWLVIKWVVIPILLIVFFIL